MNEQENKKNPIEDQNLDNEKTLLNEEDLDKVSGGPSKGGFAIGGYSSS